MTLPPAQKVVGPLAVMEAAGLSTVTTDGALVALQPPALVTVTL